MPSLHAHIHTHPHQTYIQRQQQQLTAEVKQQKSFFKKNEEIVAEHQRNPTICYFIFSALKLHIRDNDSHIHRTQKKITHIHFPVCCTFSMQLYMRASHTGFHLQKPKSAWESVSIGRTIIAYTHCSLDDDDDGDVPCVREREFYIFHFTFLRRQQRADTKLYRDLKPTHAKQEN